MDLNDENLTYHKMIISKEAYNFLWLCEYIFSKFVYLLRWVGVSGMPCVHCHNNMEKCSYKVRV